MDAIMASAESVSAYESYGVRLGILLSAALVIAGLFVAGAAQAQPPATGDVGFTTAPDLFPGFSPDVRDYVVRCNNAPVTVNGYTSSQWEAKVADHPFMSGDFTEAVPLTVGQAFTVGVRRVGKQTIYRYRVRCLPNDFPNYSYSRDGSVSPRFFGADVDFGPPLVHRYVMIFDDHGVPIWWDHVPGRDVTVLPSGNLLWFDRASNHWEIHRLDGSLIRTLDAVGQPANRHDLQVLGNGSYLAGSNVQQSHVDTSAYGGSGDADVANAELQQVGFGGDLRWRWKSQNHISLAETGHWWNWARTHPAPEGYDIMHWNSIEPDGRAVVASFRHLDAVYKIRKSTGRIVWKLGGTETSKSLTVKGDRHIKPLGGQHDARVLPDGTVTVFDNRSSPSSAGDLTPEAVRFRIDPKKRTATLLESISDPNVSGSSCCGSARRLPNGDWLIDWGGGKATGIGGYQRDGDRTFFLKFDSGFSYRAVPVPDGVVSAQDLRHGMVAMYRGQ